MKRGAGLRLEDHPPRPIPALVLRRRGVSGEELIQEVRGDVDQSRTIDTILQAAQGRWQGERWGAIRELAGGDLECGIGSQALMIVAVFLTEGDGGDALGEQGVLVGDEEGRMARVGDDLIEGVEESGAIGVLTEQQTSGSSGQSTAKKVGVPGAGLEPVECPGRTVKV